MASYDILARNNSHLVRLTSLTGPASSAVESSTGITATVYRSNGDAVTGGSTWPVALVATSSVANDYEVAFSSTGFVLTDQETATCVVSVDLGTGTVGEFVRELRFQPRTV